LPFSGNAPVSLRIFNLLGQSVRELVNAVQPAGQYEVRWDGRLDNGNLAPAGIYFYRLRAGQQMLTRKLMLLNR
jgi:flagellar hook assembly protein FlgD